ncbi:DnaJ domain-containing protein [Desulforhopalus sp. 52FAK]
MPQNYYIILGIPKNSSQDEIRAAYRRLAKEYHPDHYGNDQAPFQILQEAYSVLSNPKSRKSYDHSLQPESRMSSPVRHTENERYANINIEPLIPGTDINLSNLNSSKRSFQQQRPGFDDMFGRLRWENSELYDSEIMRPQDVSFEISLSRVQAQIGGNVRVHLPVQVTCPSCQRHFRYTFVCRRCNGTGVLMTERPVLIRYPAGVRDNHVIKSVLHPHDTQKIYMNVIFKIH